MTFITRTFSEFTPSELELLKVTPPTAESRALANRVGQRMGEYAYPGDMVRESVTCASRSHLGLIDNPPLS